MDFDAIREAKKIGTARAWVPLEPGLTQRYEDLQDDLLKAHKHDATTNDKDTAPAVEDEIAEVEQRIADSRAMFEFTAIGRKPYNAILKAHPPKKPDDKVYGFDPLTFPPALLAATAINPTLTPDQAMEIWEEWSDAEATLLFETALKPNRTVADVPFTRGGIDMATLATVKPSTTPLSVASHLAGS